MVEFLTLERLMSTPEHPMLKLLQFIKQQLDLSSSTVHCPKEWSNLISSLASPSPVCSLVHPCDKLFSLLKKITDSGTDIASDLESMRFLQQEVPVLFTVLDKVKNIPKKSLIPLIDELINKSKEPFRPIEDPCQLVPIISDENMLSFFPQLPQIRTRAIYNIDDRTKHKERCSKQSSGHPALLPGIFTLFCPHGMSYR